MPASYYLFLFICLFFWVLCMFFWHCAAHVLSFYFCVSQQEVFFIWWIQWLAPKHWKFYHENVSFSSIRCILYINTVGIFLGGMPKDFCTPMSLKRTIIFSFGTRIWIYNILMLKSRFSEKWVCFEFLARFNCSISKWYRLLCLSWKSYSYCIRCLFQVRGFSVHHN